MTIQETKKMPIYTRWAGIGGSIKWEPNKADILQGVIAENSPIGRQTFTPKNITQEPNTDVASHYERTNTGRPKRHHFESPLFHWLPSFRDFRKNQVQFAVDDLTRQRQVALDMFIRTQAFNYAPNVYICRKTGDPIDNTLGSGEATDTSSPKSLAALAAKINDIGFENLGYLDYRMIVAVRAAARHTIGIQPMEGWKGKAPDNETAKGKFLLLGEPGIYENMQFDSHMLNNRPLAMNLVQSDFSGVIAENIVFREEKFPERLKIASDGTVTRPNPEIEKKLPSTGYGSDERYETVPNPDYVNAEIGIAYLIGYEPWDDITVGPPPSEFAGSGMSQQQFGKLNWNGEMRVIKPAIISYPSGVYASNDYGGWLKIICDCVMGFMPKTPRFILPILYRRDKYPSLRLL
jgi:hypothetical protein